MPRQDRLQQRDAQGPVRARGAVHRRQQDRARGVPRRRRAGHVMVLRRKKNGSGDDDVVELVEKDGIFDEVGDEVAETEPAEKGAVKGSGGWGRVVRGNRGLWVTALIAVVALGGGIALGRFVVSPFDRAAGEEAPEPGLVTVPVEFGELNNDVTIRGDVGYDAALELKSDTVR